MSACNFEPPESLPGYTAADPEVVWRRISLFLYDEARDADYELPEETTPGWVATLVSSILDAHHDAGDGAPAGLAKFIRTWAFDGSETETAVEWAAPLVNPDASFVTDLFGPRAGDATRKSLLEDEAFLTAFPRAPLRAVWISANLLCNPISPPPSHLPHDPAPPPGPSQTGRQVHEEMMNEPVCAGCHYNDPLGFSLEHYDQAGAFREFDNGLPVDSSGSINLHAYGDLSFTDNAHLLSQITPLCEVGSCVSSALLDYALDQAYEGNAPEIPPAERQYVLSALASEYHRLRPMILALVTTPSFLKE